MDFAGWFGDLEYGCGRATWSSPAFCWSSAVWEADTYRSMAGAVVVGLYSATKKQTTQPTNHPTNQPNKQFLVVTREFWELHMFVAVLTTKSFRCFFSPTLMGHSTWLGVKALTVINVIKRFFLTMILIIRHSKQFERHHESSSITSNMHKLP